MYSALSFPRQQNPWNQAFYRLINLVGLLLPYILLSLAISLLGSIILTSFSYGLSAIFGWPAVPFFLIII